MKRKKWASEDDEMLMRLKGRGCSTGEIADIMGITKCSAKNHMDRLGISSKYDFSQFAEPGSPVRWTDSENAILDVWWPLLSKDQVKLMAPRLWPRHSPGSIDYAARRMHLYKLTFSHRTYGEMDVQERDRLFCLICNWHAKGADADHIVSCIMLQTGCGRHEAMSSMRHCLEDYKRCGGLFTLKAHNQA